MSQYVAVTLDSLMKTVVDLCVLGNQCVKIMVRPT